MKRQPPPASDAHGLVNRIEDIILSPPERPVPPAWDIALGLLSRGYAVAAGVRAALYRGPWRHRQQRLSVPVVSVGNLTVGGTGKTPMVAYLADTLSAAGLRPAVVSRGYRGGLERDGGIVSDGRRIRHDADAAGDEPFMLAMQLPGVPVAVGRRRHAAGARLIASCGPDVILLDDGFQHLQLARDVNLLLADARYPLGNGHVLPRGPLREPPRAARRAHAVVFTRAGDGAMQTAAGGGVFRGIPAFGAVHRVRILRPADPDPASPVPGALSPAADDVLRGRRVAAFSGIADNRRFQRSIAALGTQVAAFTPFPDHHHYTDGDVAALEARAAAAGAVEMVTTEKDYYRLLPQAPALCARLTVVGVRIAMPADEDRFRRWLTGRLAQTGAQRSTPLG